METLQLEGKEALVLRMILDDLESQLNNRDMLITRSDIDAINSIRHKLGMEGMK